MADLSGGLNLWDLSYNMRANQSPDSVNMYWKDGTLSSRPGQAYLYQSQGTSDPYGKFHSCYKREWIDGFIIAHKGTSIYKISLEDGTHTSIYSGTLTESSGAFFVFSDKLYYMNGHEYVQITKDGEATDVEPYIPVVVINRTPSGSGGNQYQPENRLASGKTIWFTSDGESTTYVLPYQELEPDRCKVVVNGTTLVETYSASSVAGFPNIGQIGVIYKTTSPSGIYTWVSDEYKAPINMSPSEFPVPSVRNQMYRYQSSSTNFYMPTDNKSDVTRTKAETNIPSGTVTVDDSTISEKFTKSGVYAFSYVDSSWTYNGEDVVLSDYGITITGTPNEYSVISVTIAYYAYVYPYDTNSQYSVNRTNGTISFGSAPTQTSPITANNVKVTVYKGDEATKQSILSCKCVTVFGGDNNLAVVCGGPDAQPNAYFWSGNHDYLDPTYFPFDYYNFAGTADEKITAFGKQQNMLVIFKERSIGKSYFSTETINSRDYLKLSYTPISDTIGCDAPGTVKLIQNNLVFANTYAGVFVLMDTSAAGENNVTRISRNINGDKETKGVLYDLKKSDYISSYDDNQRYWLIANGNAYLWDYSISSYRSPEEKISWFFFTNINAKQWSNTFDYVYYGADNGSIVRITPDVYSDFGGAIVRKYTFATQYFGSYESLKDVLKVVFAVRSDTNSVMTITYDTDWESRKDLTDIVSNTWKTSPRNLTERDLSITRYAGTAVRIPRCFHIKHFSMTLENNIAYTDMSLISAQVIYRFSQADR